MVTSWPVSAFGGKVAATRHPMAFVPDCETSLTDLDFSFSQGAGVESRGKIIRRNHVDFLLFGKHRTPDWEANAHPFLEGGGWCMKITISFSYPLLRHND